MNGVRVVGDTNVILYLLRGDKDVSEILQSKDLYLSFITEIELLSFKNLTAEETAKIKSFLSDCFIVDINSDIKHTAIHFRKKYSLKLPDAIILATAHFLDVPLITADKIYKKVEEMTIIILEK